MATRTLSRRRFLKGVGVLAAATALPARAESPPTPPAPARTTLRFGVTAPQQAPYADILRFWQSADELGLDSAFVFDHFMPLLPDPERGQAYFEGWSLLAALAAQTSRIRLGVMVTGNTYRYPAIVAKMAATIDHVSRGRVILGMGAAWFEREHTAYGIPFYTPGGRARRLVESVEVMKLLFTQERSTFHGKYYTLADAPFAPKAVQTPHPPLLIGGMGPKVIQPLAARHAQIWHFMAPKADRAEYERICAEFDRICRDVGRDPAEVEKATSLDPKIFRALSPDAQRAQLRELVDAGVGRVVFLPAASDEQGFLRHLATEIMPEFRGA